MGPVTVEASLSLRRPADVVMSADGGRIAASVPESSYSAPPNGPQARIWVIEGDGEPRCVTDGPGVDAIPRWSPEGCLLAFGSERSTPGRTVPYVLDLESSDSARPICTDLGSVEEMIWSRDGRTMLMLAAGLGADRPGAMSATKIEERATTAEDPRVSRERLGWRRLFLVDVDSGTAREVGPEGATIWQVDWDGVDTAVVVTSSDPTEGGWYGATLDVLELSSGRVVARYQPSWQIASPRLSPDGARVAFVEELSSDRDTLAGTPMCAEISAGGAGVEALSPIKLSEDLVVGSLAWHDDARTLYYTALKGVRTACGILSLDGSSGELWSGPATLGNRHRIWVSPDASGRKLAAVKESTSEPPEVVLMDRDAADGAWRSLTTFNASLRELDLPEWQERRWTGPDGLEIEGLLALPAERPATGLPLVVIVHGGPAGCWSHMWHNETPRVPFLWASAGYAVLLPNPRGSKGVGATFVRGNVEDLGGRDFQDILTGVDALVADGTVDSDRVGIVGNSYGGYMSAWAVGQTDRFAAAIPMASCTNWTSFRHTSNIGDFLDWYLKGSYRDASSDYYLRSPVMYADKVTTPTLIIHGELDLCVPVSQAQEMYQAIRDEGSAEVELVVYPREGHSYRERDHQIDIWRRSRAWFDRHLGVEA